MTVRELVDKLARVDPTLEVLFDDYEQGPITPLLFVQTVDVGTMVRPDERRALLISTERIHHGEDADPV